MAKYIPEKLRHVMLKEAIMFLDNFKAAIFFLVNIILYFHKKSKFHHHHLQVVLVEQIFLTLSLSLLIHRFLQLLRLTSCVHPKLMWISFCRSANTGISMCRGGPLKNVTYKFILVFPAVFHISYSSYLDGFWEGRQVTV